MNLRQITGKGQSNATNDTLVELPNSERFLTLVVEGAALGVPEIDGEIYSAFRSNIGKLALQLPDRLPDEREARADSRRRSRVRRLSQGR